MRSAETLALALALGGLAGAGCGAAVSRADREGPPAVLDVSPRSEAGDAADGSPARPFATLAAAVEQAPSGALVRLDEGEYAGGLIVSRPLVLMGKGPGRTRIVPGGAGLPVLAVRGTGHVEVRGLSVEGGTLGVVFEGGDGHLLRNVALRGQAQTALVVRAGEVALSECEVAATGGGRAGVGIEAFGGSLRLQRCVLRSAGRRAVVLHGGRALLEDVAVDGAAVSGLQALDGADVRVRGGSFAHMGGPALYAGGARLHLAFSRVFDNEYGVLAFRGAKVMVEATLLEDHRIAAVALVQSSGKVVRSSIVRGGSEGGVSAMGAPEPVVLEDDRIVDPGRFGVHLSDASAIIRGSEISYATSDAQHDLGDGIYAIDSSVTLRGTVLRGNQGSGAWLVRSTLTSESCDFLENLRAGVSLLDRTSASASGSLFRRNGDGLLVGERSDISLSGNVFDGNARFAIDASCGEETVVRTRGRETQYRGANPRARTCP